MAVAQLPVWGRPHGQAEVGMSFVDAGQKGVGGRLHERELDLRLLAAEGSYGLRNQRGADGGQCGNRHAAAPPLKKLPQFPKGTVKFPQDALCNGKQFLADGSDFDVARVTVEQPGLEGVLCLPDGSAESGLRHADLRRRSTETSRSHDLNKRLQLLESEVFTHDD